METFGDKIRELRMQKKLPLRTVSEFLQIDQAILSKIERGHRKPTRDQVVKLAAYFEADVNDMLVSWLSDKLVDELEAEDVALQALQMAEEKVYYMSKPLINRRSIIDNIRAVLQADGRIAAAWLFGSFARDEDKRSSDIDMMVELKKERKYSIFDLLDIAHVLGNRINRKVDIVEKGYLKPFALQTAENELVKIYG